MISQRSHVQSAAVDPGGVITNVWKGRFAKPPFSWLIHGLFSPSYDGAKVHVDCRRLSCAMHGATLTADVPKAIVHAATVDLDKKGPAPAPLRNGKRGVTSGALRVTLCCHSAATHLQGTQSRGRVLSLCPDGPIDTASAWQFYAKGTFAWPAVYLYTPTDGALGQVKQWLWMATAAILAGVDWPIRNSSRGDQPTCSDQVSELELAISTIV